MINHKLSDDNNKIHIWEHAKWVILYHYKSNTCDIRKWACEPDMKKFPIITSDEIKFQYGLLWVNNDYLDYDMYTDLCELIIKTNFIEIYNKSPQQSTFELKLL